MKWAQDSAECWECFALPSCWTAAPPGIPALSLSTHTSTGSENRTGLCHCSVTGRLELTILICCWMVVCFLLNRPGDKMQVCHPDLLFFPLRPMGSFVSFWSGAPSSIKTLKINYLFGMCRLLCVDDFTLNSTRRVMHW